MKSIIKSIPIISALVVSNAAFSQETPETSFGRPPTTVVPFDQDGDGVLNEDELARRDELTGRALILRVYDLNGDGVVDPVTERLNFSEVFRNLRTLTLEDFPQLPLLGIPTDFQQFDLNGDNTLDFSERSNARRILFEEARSERRAGIREVANLFGITPRQVRIVRRTLLRDSSEEEEIAPELVPVREELRQRRAADLAEKKALRASRFELADFDGNGTLDFSEFLTLPATRGVLVSRPNNLERTLQALLGAFVRRDLNSSLEFELREFRLNTGDFLGN